MKTNYEYSIIINYSKEDNCYIASVPELGPYISAFGDSYENALREIQSVIELTLQTYKDDKLSPPKRINILTINSIMF